MTVSPIPQGFQALCPYMMVQNANRTLVWLKEVLGAEVRGISEGPNGIIMNAEIKVGDSMMMLSDCRDHTPRPATIYMYVKNCDELYHKAIAAGATMISEPADMFYGDRHGGVTDPGGNQWWFATHIEDVSGEEVTRRAAAFYKRG